ncbi:unnamed protein product, partial [Tetraodon nigroviridis]
ITAWEAAWNVTNAIQGIFVLGLPFALVRSGYLGLVLMVLSAWVCNHTGRILVACLYEEQEQSLSIMLFCMSQAGSWSWSSLPLSVAPEDFLVSVGVIIFSYTSQIFLPPLEGNMVDRGQFNAMLGWTHGAACIMKTAFSLLAVLTWGSGTCEVITKNLPSDLRPLVNMCLLAKALLSFALPFYSAAEILQNCLLTDAEGSGISRPALLVRAGLLMASYLLALLVPRFSLLMGLTGSVTGATMTLILPCLCHLRLQRGRLTRREHLTDVCILITGVVCGVSGIFCSVKRLLV